ncbi:DUF6358 family protein [Arcticibacter sp. MXS-1]|uniref:DUF6358 family protein n=1 Tax=Arcticibacter sp. MXS-1 TaxID=3341726 RepID=UPI0035A83146
MFKRIVLNIIYNLSLIFLVFSLVWSFNNRHYGLIVACLFLLGLILYLKMRLVKEVKEFARKPKR